MDQAPTLNPFLLFRRCLQSGRFTRSEFAIAYGGAWAFVFLGVFVAGVLATLLGLSEQTRGFAVALLVLLGLLLLLPISIGSVLRRLADSGNSGWLALFLLVPCVNVLFLLYLLFAPTTEKPASATPAVILLVAAVVAVLMVPVIGIIAAIAIPSLLRARVSANEAATQGDIRSVISAQAAYSSVSNGAGYAKELRCLARPAEAGCLPDYSGPPFLGTDLEANPMKSGYRRSYSAEATPEGMVEGFCYSARPATLNRTGTRSFAGDASGVLVAVAGDRDCCDGPRVDTVNCAALY